MHLASRHRQVDVVRLLQARGVGMYSLSQPRVSGADSVCFVSFYFLFQ
jgi:hypothetical protein